MNQIVQFPASHPAFHLRRIAVFTLIVFLSIALPVGIIGYSLHFAMAGKQSGRPSQDTQFFYRGCLKNREFWHHSYRYVGQRGLKPFEYLVYRLNIETGKETVFEVSPDFKWPLWIDNELYGIGKFVYRVVDGAFAKIAELPAGSFNHPWFFTEVFNCDGRLTMVVERNNGRFLLCRLVDDQWIEGREIRVPSPASQWRNDPQNGFRLNVPESSQQTKPAGRRLSLHCVQDEHGDIHLLYRDHDNDFVAYRNGFDFIDHDQKIVSALSPENTPAARHQQVSSGWEPIQPKNRDAWWNQIEVDRDGVLICESSRRGRIIRRNKSGDWVELDGQVELESTHYLKRSILVDQSDGAGYILDTNNWWNSVAAYRIDGNTVQASDVLKQGLFSEYFARWSGLIAGIFLAWLIHAGFMACATAWIERGAPSSNDALGPQPVILSSMARRGMAFFADVLLLSAIVVLLTIAQYPLFGITFPSSTFYEVCQLLSTVDLAVDDIIGNGFSSFMRSFSRPPSQPSIDFPIHGYRELLITELIEILLLLGIATDVEGRIGITPGKWLFGIRTVRTSGRSCGFARALLRKVLLGADFPLLVTPLPAAISMMLSPNRQRLGDRVAETIVVNADSIRRADEAV